MYISLPITTGKNKVVIQELIDDFIASEIMDGDDKWNCPRCKVPRRATKTLTIARLPPIVIIQLKRFTTKNGVFWDKSENHVIFPMQGLDLTRYVPYRAKRGGEDMDDPRTQIGPFKYDLYGVSNHIGTLSSGHCESSFLFPPFSLLFHFLYLCSLSLPTSPFSVTSILRRARLMPDTAFVKDAKGWKFAEDSRISKAQEKDIVVSPPFSIFMRSKLMIVPPSIYVVL
jgi:ubiquitin carboxyl-terminal hydrolase 8